MLPHTSYLAGEGDTPSHSPFLTPSTPTVFYGASFWAPMAPHLELEEELAPRTRGDRRLKLKSDSATGPHNVSLDVN